MFTVWPFDNMGVMTMKMISSTSITSTMGVTLISDYRGRFGSFILNSSQKNRYNHSEGESPLPGLSREQIESAPVPSIQLE